MIWLCLSARCQWARKLRDGGRAVQRVHDAAATSGTVGLQTLVCRMRRNRSRPSEGFHVSDCSDGPRLARRYRLHPSRERSLLHAIKWTSSVSRSWAALPASVGDAPGPLVGVAGVLGPRSGFKSTLLVASTNGCPNRRELTSAPVGARSRALVAEAMDFHLGRITAIILGGLNPSMGRPAAGLRTCFLTREAVLPAQGPGG